MAEKIKTMLRHQTILDNRFS